MRAGKRKRKRIRSVRVVGPCAVSLHMLITVAMKSRRHYRALLEQQRDNPRARPELWAKWVSHDAMRIRRYRKIMHYKQAVEYYKQICQVREPAQASADSHQ